MDVMHDGSYVIYTLPTFIPAGDSLVSVKDDGESGSILGVDWALIRDIFYDWSMSNCSVLSIDGQPESLQRALQSLYDKLSLTSIECMPDEANLVLLCKGKKWISLFPDSMRVGDALYMYQTADSAVLAFADAVSVMAVQVAQLIYSLDGKDAPVADDVLSDEQKENVVNQVELEIKEALRSRGIDVDKSVSDSLPALRLDKVHAGEVNTFDIPHTLETYQHIRDSRGALSRILDMASKQLGVGSYTVDSYQALCDSDTHTSDEKKFIDLVSDLTLRSNELDLICPSLYKRKLEDPYWYCDAASDIANSFGLELPSSIPVDSPVRVLSLCPANLDSPTSLVYDFGDGLLLGVGAL